MFYSDEIIEEVRSQNDIVDIISSYVKLNRKGNSYMGLCPFHNEKTPSFSVSGSKQMYHCFGCGVGGNVFTFVMEYENYSFVEAVKYLADRAGIKLPEGEASPAEKRKAEYKSRLLEVNKEAAKFYYAQLKSSHGAVGYQYLKERGLSDETIRRFGLGYAGKTVSLYQYLKQKGYDDELLKDSGLFTMDESRGAYDKFWNRVMFPIMDVNHKVIGFGGRVMGDAKPKYLNSPETKVFDKSRNLFGLNFAKSQRSRQIILCEGYMDVIALHQAGFTNAVASLGTAFTGLQANLLKRYADEVLLTYDSDEAGVKAALRAIPILKEAGLSARIIHMEPYKDPDEFIKNLGEDAFRERIRDAQNSLFFEVDKLSLSYNRNDPEGKTNFTHALAKRLAQIEDEVARNNYVDALANQYLIEKEMLRRLVNQYGNQMLLNLEKGMDLSPPLPEGERKRSKPEDGMRQSQKILLTWLIEDNGLFGKVKGILSPRDFPEEPYHTVAELLFEQYEKTGQTNPAAILSHFESTEEQKEAASMFHAGLSATMEPSEREKALNETVIRIKMKCLEEAGRNVTDIQQLQKIIQEKKELQKLHISLK
ncbi:MAG: DNA primase [Clostridiales bacterium]|nr:DNA primase [Clostridiales bacterium]